MTYEDWTIGWEARQKMRKRRLKLIQGTLRLKALIAKERP